MRNGRAFHVTLIACLLLVACASTPIRYFASDICLVKKEETTKKDVESLFGTPNTIENASGDHENWYYYDVQESFLYRLPYIGKTLGTRKVETIKIEFRGDVVSGSCYTVKQDAG